MSTRPCAVRAYSAPIASPSRTNRSSSDIVDPVRVAGDYCFGELVEVDELAVLHDLAALDLLVLDGRPRDVRQVEVGVPGPDLERRRRTEVHRRVGVERLQQRRGVDLRELGHLIGDEVDREPRVERELVLGGPVGEAIHLGVELLDRLVARSWSAPRRRRRR